MPAHIPQHTREQQIAELCDGTLHSFVGWDSTYKNCDSKFICRCEKHGDWLVSVDAFVNGGSRCPGCGGVKRRSALERENEIKKLCEGTIYSFSGWGGDFKGVRTPLLMSCEIHGKWSMYLPDFYKGVRCAACKRVKNLSEDEVMTRINLACSNKNFHFVKWEDGYVNSKSRAVFKCDEHGEWTTLYVNITRAMSGCPICSDNGFNPNKKGYLYLLESLDGNFMKVGITNNLKRRTVELKRTTPFRFRLRCSVSDAGKNVASLEKIFHGHFENSRLQGFNGASEWLKWNPEIPLWFEYLNCQCTHAHSASKSHELSTVDTK